LWEFRFQLRIGFPIFGRLRHWPGNADQLEILFLRQRLVALALLSRVWSKVGGEAGNSALMSSEAGNLCHQLAMRHLDDFAEHRPVKSQLRFHALACASPAGICTTFSGALGAMAKNASARFLTHSPL